MKKRGSKHTEARHGTHDDEHHNDNDEYEENENENQENEDENQENEDENQENEDADHERVRDKQGKSRAGTKKRPRNPSPSESEHEDHTRKSTRTKVVRVEETGPREEERMEEIVKVGPPKGKSSMMLFDSDSNSTGRHPTTSTHPFLPRFLRDDDDRPVPPSRSSTSKSNAHPAASSHPSTSKSKGHHSAPPRLILPRSIGNDDDDDPPSRPLRPPHSTSRVNAAPAASNTPAPVPNDQPTTSNAQALRPVSDPQRSPPLTKATRVYGGRKKHRGPSPPPLPPNFPAPSSPIRLGEARRPDSRFTKRPDIAGASFCKTA